MNRKSEKGQTLVFVALLITVLLAFAGLAIDMGVLRYEKRLQQSAADAAAIAGASNLAYGGVTSAAQSAAAANGFNSGSDKVSDCTGSGAAVGTVCVQVNNPPASGPHAGNNNYVEALVGAVHATYFMKVLGINKEAITARAVATNLSGGPSSGCLYTLGPPASSIEGVNLNGSAFLNATTCGIIDNGNFNTKGNALTVNAGSFGVSGNPNVSGPGGTVTCSAPGPCPTYGMPAAADPLAKLTPPSKPAPFSGCPATGCDVSTSNTQTLQPGTYNSITFGKNSTVTLSPGIYYIDGAGGVTFGGSATVKGSGVMFYFTGSASINAVGGGNQVSNIQLSAPTTGPYAGILMYQDPNDTNTGPGPNKGPTLGGDDKSFFDGVLYFPKDQLTFFGNSKSTGYSAGIVVADAIALSGNPTVNLQGAAGLPPGTDPILNAVLVE